MVRLWGNEPRANNDVRAPPSGDNLRSLSEVPAVVCGHRSTGHPNAGVQDEERYHDDERSDLSAASVHGEKEQYPVY